MTERSDPRIARSILGEANRASGGRFELVGPLNGGFQSGTWLLTDHSRRAVLKWSPNRDWAPQVQRAAEAVARIRATGYPTPTWLSAGISQDGYGYQVQEFVPGRPIGRVTVDIASKLISLLERHSGLDPDPGRCWSAYVQTGLTGPRPDLLHQVTDLGPHAADLATSCERLLTVVGPAELPRRDMVHGDFRPGNIILHRGLVNGVIDIEAIGSGSRVYDYATLLSVEDMDPAAEQMIITAGERVAGPGALALCFAEVALSLARFAQERRPGHGDRLLGWLRQRVDERTSAALGE